MTAPGIAPTAALALRSRSLRVAAAIAVAVGLGGIPGAALRSIAGESSVPDPTADALVHDGSVEATVRSAPGLGGRPIAGAHIHAFAIVDERAYVAGDLETDGEGRALLQGLPHAAIWIVAEAPGRARGSTRLVVGSERRVVSLELGESHAFDVAVQDEAGMAIAGAEVEVLEATDPLPIGARSASDGVAHVTRLGGGPWHVTARAPGFEDAEGRAAQDGEHLTIVLRKLGALLVHVVGEGGASVDGALVAVAGATLWPARSTETDARGGARLGGLTAGVYALRASRGDLVSAIELGVSLARGEEKPVELRIRPGRWVGVRVTDGDSDGARSVASARVTLAEGGLSPFPLEAITDAKGRALLGPIAPGGATCSASADGFVPRGAFLLADPPPAETLIALLRAGVLTGRVVDARGYAIDGATIEIAGTDPNGAPIVDDPRRASFQAAHFDAMLGGPAPLVAAGELGVTPGPVPPIPMWAVPLPQPGQRGPVDADPWVTREDGTFRAAPASPGRLRAVVHHPQFVEAESDLVTLEPGGEARVEIVMQSGGSLEGRVVDSHDRPVRGARVVASAAGATVERAARTATDGTFAFAVLPERVVVTASTEDDDQPGVRVALSIPAGERQQVTLRLPAPREPVEVTVVDDRGFPIGAAQVTATSLSVDDPLHATAFTDARGEALVRRARGLPLRIEATAPGHAPRAVTADEASDATRIDLGPAESAAGEVVAERGASAIQGAEVALYSDAGVRRVRTDARGTFALHDLAPGPATLRVRAAGFASVGQEVTVPDSAGRTPFAIDRITLAAEALVEGRVVDARGEPVVGARVAKDRAPAWLVAGGASDGVAVTDGQGRFLLGELPEGAISIEAYAPYVGRGRVDDLQVMGGRRTYEVRVALEAVADDARSANAAGGGMAVALGETAASQVVFVSVAAASEAERAGLVPGDVLISVNGAPVHSIEEARSKLGGPVFDDVVVRIRRYGEERLLRVPREPLRR